MQRDTHITGIKTEKVENYIAFYLNMWKIDKALKIMVLLLGQINKWKSDCMQLSIIHIHDLLSKNSINYSKIQICIR